MHTHSIRPSRLRNRIFRWVLLIVPVLPTVFLFPSATEDRSAARIMQVQEVFRSDADSLHREAKVLQQLLATSGDQPTTLRAQFVRCRRAYKRTEVLTAYLFPATEQLLNAPPIPEADEEEGTQLVRTPDGLQHIGELLYADSLSEEERQELHLSIARFVSGCLRLRQLSSGMLLTDWQLMEALRLEVIRTYTLGLAGFDTPEYSIALSDAAATAVRLRDYATLYLPQLKTDDRRKAAALQQALDAYCKALTAPGNPEAFDRLAFIRNVANPLSRALSTAAVSLQLRPIVNMSALRFEAATPFDRNAIDPWFYARVNRTEYRRPEVAALGRLLFFEPLLSGNGERSCASCHRPDRALADGLAKSVAFTGSDAVLRNAPTLWNAGYQATQFYDARVNFLEDQARFVVANGSELHGDITATARVLQESNEYRSLFNIAFRGTEDTIITPRSIFIAIAAFERTLTATEAPFYRYMRGETKHYPQAAADGFNLFTGKAACGTCHFLPFFNGTVPPLYAKGEVEIIGVPSTTDTLHPVLDTDEGRMRVNNMELHRFAFKTPGLTNIAQTAPYMHNGIYTTLGDVVDFYNRGGGTGLGIAPVNQTLPEDPLLLSAAEKAALVSFLETLSDPKAVLVPPAQLPMFPDAARNARRVGGSY